MLNERVILIDLSAGGEKTGPRERILRKFPFRIGRLPDPAPPTQRALGPLGRHPRFGLPLPAVALQANDLDLQDPGPPFQVSRNLVEIGFLDGQLYVRDVGSAVGTMVNGTSIGGQRRAETLLLEQSETEIVLGTAQSPWRFALVTPSAKVRPRVLIADDEAMIRSVLRKALEGAYDVIEVDNGKDALEAAFGRDPDVVLLDWMMPELDGVRVCKTIKTNLATANLPVVMVTGMNLTGDRITAIEAGADDYIMKPVNRDELRVRVNAVVARARRARNTFWLTGIPSEMGLREELDTLLERSAETAPSEYDLLLVILHGLGRLQQEDGERATELVQKRVAEILYAITLRNARSAMGQIALGRWAVMLPADNARETMKTLDDALNDALAGHSVAFDLRQRSAVGFNNYYDLMEAL